MLTAMQAAGTSRKPRPDTYRKVCDPCSRRVRGLWQRNGRFFAHLAVTDDPGRKATRMVLVDATTLDEAKAESARFQIGHADDRLRPLGLTAILPIMFKFTRNAL